MLKAIAEFLNTTYDELIAIFIIVVVLSVNGYQTIVGAEVYLPYELTMIVAGYLFGKKVK